MWISIERSLFIFHGNLYNTAKRRLFFHYLPLITIIIYVFFFYAVAIFIYPCKQQFDFTQPLCGFPCYTNYANISLYDVIAHTGIPLLFSIMLDSTLIIRVMCRKRVGMQQHFGAQWSKYRKMVIQLLSISSLCLSCQIPFASILFLELVIVLPDLVSYIQTVYFYYLFWLLTLLLPIVCMACMTEVTNKLKNSFIQRTRRNMTVMPMTIVPKTTIHLQNRL
jgi:hypothetical protein